jgi:AAA domain
MQAKELTQSQLLAIENLYQFVLENKPFSRYRLTGYAGTGKSVTLIYLAEYLAMDGRQVVIALPTHEAKQNVKKLLSIDSYKVIFLTVAQLLNKSPIINDHGQKEFKRKERTATNPLDTSDLIIIDESSMISAEDFDELETISLPIIFVGDNAQLPPINEPISKVYQVDYPESTLIEVIRYDGAVAYIAEEIRQNPLYQHQVYPFKTTEEKDILCLSQSQLIRMATRIFESEKYREDFNLATVACWRNKTVDFYNREIRKAVFGEDVLPFIVGDRLLVKSPVKRQRAGKDVILFQTSERLEIIDTPRPKTYHFYEREETFDYWVFPVKVWGDENQPPLELNVLDGEGKNAYDKYLKEIAKKAKAWNKENPNASGNPFWKVYYSAKEAFDDVGYAYARTIHRLQGSTIKHLLFVSSDLTPRCKELQQLQYTAVTRVKERLYIG